MRTASVIFFLLLSSTPICQCTAEDLLVTISEKTTHITSPLTADGYPDYLAALNARFRTKSNPQNNLAVGIWETVGSTEIPVELRPLLFEALGVDGIPVEGDYLVGLGTYQKQQLGEFPRMTKHHPIKRQGYRIFKSYRKAPSFRKQTRGNINPRCV